MNWTERIDNYAMQTGFPKSLFVGPDGRVVGTWIMGNDYRVKSTYYGGYPAGYLRRVRALFPDKQRTLHLFSGMVDLALFPGDTVDLNDGFSPTYVDDAQSLKLANTPTAMKALARTTRRAFSLAFAALKLGRTTISAGVILRLTLAKWLGARITAAFQMASNI